MSEPDAGIDVRRAGERYLTAIDGRSTRHSFAFGTHYDPDNLGFAALVAHNEEDLPPGTGYPEHPHADTEIVTWVLTGALRHSDTDGNTGVLLPGDVQRVSAGSGIVHSETTEPGVHTRFVQTWLRPDQAGGDPSYAVVRADPAAGLVEVVGPAGLPIGVAGARLQLAAAADGELVLPDAPRLHVFVADGLVRVGDQALAAGDTARLTDRGGLRITVAEPASLAVWAFGN